VFHGPPPVPKTLYDRAIERGGHFQRGRERDYSRYRKDEITLVGDLGHPAVVTKIFAACSRLWLPLAGRYVYIASPAGRGGDRRLPKPDARPASRTPGGSPWFPGQWSPTRAGPEGV